MTESLQAWKVGDRKELVRQLSEQDVADFARISGDYNPLHMDEAYAKKTLAGGKVVHGMLGASLVSTLIGEHLPGKGALWNRFEVRWEKMMRVNDTLKIVGIVEKITLSTNTMELSISASNAYGGEFFFRGRASVQLLDEADSKNPSGACTQENFLRDSDPANQTSFAKKQNSKSTQEKNSSLGLEDQSDVSLLSSPKIAMGFASPKETQTQMEPILLSDKNAYPFLITGASGALGGAIARKLAQDGHKLIVWGRKERSLLELKQELGDFVVAVQSVDLLNSDSIEEALLELGTPFGGIIHAAAPPYRILGIEEKDNAQELLRHWTVNVQALSQIFQFAIAKNPALKVVAISSQHTKDVPPQKVSAYVSSKMALLGWIRCLAVELGPKGLRANVLSPGLMNTPFVQDLPIKQKQIEAAKNPLRRLCTPLDVAEVVAFLCSPSADFINGADIPITGGARMP